MNNKNKTKAQLISEIENLKLRLSESEETLNAIKKGEVDALVVEGPHGAQVYTLRGADQPYRILIEEMNEGAATLNPDGLILYCNRQFSQMTKTPLEKMMGSSLQSFITPPDLDSFTTLLKTALKGKITGDINVKSADGLLIPLHLSLRSLSWNSKEAISVVATDLSEQKKREETLERLVKERTADLLEREESLEAALEAGDLGTWEYDVKSDIISRSFNTDRIFDNDNPQDLKYKTFIGLIHPDDRSTVDEKLRYSLSTGVKFDISCRILGTGKPVQWIWLEGKPQTNEQNEIVKMTGLVRDITERKQMEFNASQRTKILDGINKIFEEALSDRTESELGNICLSVAEELTGSSIGFIGEIGADGNLYDITISNPGWDACKLIDQSGHQRSPGEFKIHGLYARALLDGKAFFTNSPSSEPDSAGLPEGHPPLNSFLVAPLRLRDKVIGIIAMGNREGGYSQEDLLVLQALAPVVVEAFERKRAEEALRLSERNLRGILDATRESIWLFSTDGVVLLGNPTAFARMGKSPQEIIGKRMDDILPPDLAKKRLEKLRETVESAGVINFEDERSGMLFSHNFYPVFDKEGRVVSVVSFSRDITEQRWAEETLRESEERFRSVLDNSQDIIYRKNLLTGRYEYISPSVEGALGFSPDELMNLDTETAFSMIHPDDISILREAQELAEKAGKASAEYRQLTKNGGYRWLSNHITMTRDGAGRLFSRDGNIRDITEQKEAEESLILSKEQEKNRAEELAVILDSVPAAVWIATDPQGMFIISNRLSDEWLNIPEGANASKSAPPGERPETFRAFKNGVEIPVEELPVQLAASGKKINDYEFDIVYPDNSVRTVRGNATPLFDRNGMPRGSVSAFIDITERKLAEEKLRETNAYLENLINYANAPIIVWNPEYKITTFNNAFEKLTGRKSKDVTGKPLTMLFPPDKVESSLSLIRETTGGERWESVEIEIADIDGSVKTLLWNSATIYDRSRKIPIATIAQGNDITERKLLEESLQETLKRLNLALDSAQAGTWDWDIISGDVKWSEQMFHLLGLDPGSTAASFELWHSALHPEDLKLADDRINEAFNQKKILNSDYRIVLPDGKIKWINAIGEGIYNDQGQPVSMIGLCMDITERKQAEDLLRRNEEELRKLNRTLKALSNSNQAMMRAGNEMDYLFEVCRIIVEDCSHAMVWIGFADQDEHKKVRPMAQAGFEAGYLDTLNITWADEERGRGPTGTAIRTGKISKCTNIQNDPDFEPWREEAIKRGFASSIVLPLFNGNDVFGAISIYSKEPDPFSEKEVQLLAELASDVSYGIMSLRIRSEHTKAEELLHESEEKYRLLVEYAPSAIYEIDFINNRFVTVNESMCRLAGYTEAELLSLSPAEVLDQESKKIFFERIARAQAGDSPPANVEYKGKKKDGSEVWMVLHSTFKYSGEMIVGAFVVAHDITERKLAEEALRESEERYRNLVKYAPAAIYEMDVDGTKFLSVNDVLCNILDYSREELLSIKPMDLLDHDSIQLFKERIRKKLDGEKIDDTIEYKVRKKDGGWIYTYISAGASGFSNENSPKITVIAHDITERKQAEEALKESEEKYRTLFTTENDAIFLIDKDTLRIMEVNPSAEKIYGYSRDEILGMNVLDFSNEPEETTKALSQADTYIALRHHKKKNGQVFPVEIINNLFNYKGKPVIQSVIRDITERLQIEEELRKLNAHLQEKQKLESLGILAGGIAHDFNNILMAIMGNSELGLMQTDGSSPAKPRFDAIITASQRAADICRQMLAYSGKGRFVIQLADLSQIVKEMTNMLEVSISKKALLNMNLGHGLPAIETDIAQIQQIIMNLAVNASEALEEKIGTIQISTGLVECDSKYLINENLQNTLKEGRYVYLEVSDTGCGINKTDMPKIFDPFFSTKFTGRGLGLPAVHGIVRGHKGGIRVYSEPGKGSTFKVYFPAVEAESVPALAEEAVKETRLDGHGTILLVDDEEAIRNLGRLILEGMGFKVLVAADGIEALEVFRKNIKEIVCVILDLTMPKMDGEETFRELRLIDTGIPVLISSGYNEQEVVSRFEGKGLSGFIQKPYTIKNLAGKLKEVLG